MITFKKNFFNFLIDQSFYLHVLCLSQNIVRETELISASPVEQHEYWAQVANVFEELKGK